MKYVSRSERNAWRVPIVYHQHQEQISLPHFIGKGIKYCDFKYPVDTLAGAFIKMGFANSEAIEVKGVKVASLDVLMKLVRHPVDSFFTEDENTTKLPLKFAEICVLEIKGAKSGEEMTYKISWPFTLFSNAQEKSEVYRKFGATLIGVALPAAIGAKMCMAGNAKRGVICAECLAPVKFLGMMADMGCPVKFNEVVSREVSIE